MPTRSEQRWRQAPSTRVHSLLGKLRVWDDRLPVGRADTVHVRAAEQAAEGGQSVTRHLPLAVLLWARANHIVAARGPTTRRAVC